MLLLLPHQELEDNFPLFLRSLRNRKRSINRNEQTSPADDSDQKSVRADYVGEIQWKRLELLKRFRNDFLLKWNLFYKHPGKFFKKHSKIQRREIKWFIITQGKDFFGRWSKGFNWDYSSNYITHEKTSIIAQLFMQVLDQSDHIKIDSLTQCVFPNDLWIKKQRTSTKNSLSLVCSSLTFLNSQIPPDETSF